jgi:hypothetical protein
MAAVHDAGLKQIDHLIITHWHGDHFGGLAELATRIPIREFVDHGPSVEPAAANDEFLQKGYPALYAKAKHTVAKPGDTIKVAGLEWRVVSSAGDVLKTPLPGAGQANPYCGNYQLHGPDQDPDNDASLGSVISFGRFRAVMLGDLTQDKEHALMCPNNRVGKVSLYITSHHGLSRSNSNALVHAIAPTVIVMNNGIRKGGEPATMKVLLSSPGLQDLWQLHFSLLGGQEYTAPGIFIANHLDNPLEEMPIEPMVPGRGMSAGSLPPLTHNGQAYWIKVSAQQDGTFTVTNTRNGFSKTYRD